MALFRRNIQAIFFRYEYMYVYNMYAFRQKSFEKIRHVKKR